MKKKIDKEEKSTKKAYNAGSVAAHTRLTELKKNNYKGRKYTIPKFNEDPEAYTNEYKQEYINGYNAFAESNPQLIKLKLVGGIAVSEGENTQNIKKRKRDINLDLEDNKNEKTKGYFAGRNAGKIRLGYLTSQNLNQQNQKEKSSRGRKRSNRKFPDSNFKFKSEAYKRGWIEGYNSFVEENNAGYLLKVTLVGNKVQPVKNEEKNQTTQVSFFSSKMSLFNNVFFDDDSLNNNSNEGKEHDNSSHDSLSDSSSEEGLQLVDPSPFYYLFQNVEANYEKIEKEYHEETMAIAEFTQNYKLP